MSGGPVWSGAGAITARLGQAERWVVELEAALHRTREQLAQERSRAEQLEESARRAWVVATRTGR